MPQSMHLIQYPLEPTERSMHACMHRIANLVSPTRRAESGGFNSTQRQKKKIGTLALALAGWDDLSITCIGSHCRTELDAAWKRPANAEQL